MDLEGHLHPAEGCEVVGMAGSNQGRVAVFPLTAHPPQERRHGLNVGGQVATAAIDGHGRRGLCALLLHVLLLPGLGQVAVDEALKAGHRCLGLQE